MIPLEEFARRLCVAAHGIHTGMNLPNVPCGTHLAYAQRYWGLIQPDGNALLKVIVDSAHAEGGFEWTPTTPPAGS